jgi:hypothetical protein
MSGHKLHNLLKNQLVFLALSLAVLSQTAENSPVSCAGDAAENSLAWPAELDAVRAAPNSHKVLFENSIVRVLEVSVRRPAQRSHSTTTAGRVSLSISIRAARSGRRVSITKTGRSCVTFHEGTGHQKTLPNGAHQVDGTGTTPRHRKYGDNRIGSDASLEASYSSCGAKVLSLRSGHSILARRVGCRSCCAQ